MRIPPILTAIGQLALGVLLLAFAVYMFDKLAALEATGEVAKMSTLALKVIYLAAGKWGVSGAIALAGVIFAGMGGSEIWRRLRAIRQTA